MQRVTMAVAIVVGVRGVDAGAHGWVHRRVRQRSRRGGGRRRRRTACWRLVTTRRRRRPLQRRFAAPRPGANVPSTATPSPAPAVAPKAALLVTPCPRRWRVNASLDWPGFRGRDRDGIVRGVHIATDWSASPPKELWRRPIGPGWSSFAVHGDVFYTQEQRGQDEIVAAYRVSTGAPVWKHRDAARFWESNGGAGPRGTPTLQQRPRLHVRRHRHSQRAGRGHRPRDLVAQRRHRQQHEDARLGLLSLAAADRRPGDRRGGRKTRRLRSRRPAQPRWVGPDGGPGYSSPHVLTIQGVPQILLLDAKGATSVSPSNGAPLWNVTVTSSGMAAPIVQPAMTADGDVLISAGDISGLHRFARDERAGGWSATNRWSTNGLKPYFNDFVVHEGHAYGFDGSLLACIDVADGKRKWKGGRYGNGQLVLLPDQDLLLVVTEEGRVGAGRRRPPISSPSWDVSRRSPARRGTIRCWPATSCWFATARRWRPSVSPRTAPGHHRSTAEGGITRLARGSVALREWLVSSGQNSLRRHCALGRTRPALLGLKQRRLRAPLVLSVK